MPVCHEQVGSKILAEIEIYILPKAELLCPLCYEIPCSTGEKKFQCDECGSKLSTQISLNSHKRNEHSEALECEYCDKIFGSKKRLVKHLESHLKNRDIPCTLCDKTFKVKQSLREHMNIHYETFKCIHCDKCSNTQASLDYHIKITHGTERPFTCEKCNDTFKTQRFLDLHIK